MDSIKEYVARFYTCSNRINGLYYLVAKALGVSENKFNLLYELADGAEHTQKQICTALLKGPGLYRRAAGRRAGGRARGHGGDGGGLRRGFHPGHRAL